MVKSNTYYQVQALPFTKGKAVVARVIFGVLSKRCKGLGICTITLDPPFDEEDSISAHGLISIKELDQLEFVFERKKLSNAIQEIYFGHEYFRMEEDFKLPPGLISALNLHRTHIFCGRYPIFFDEDIVRFIC